jgi:biotin transport system substrate-specific component
MELVKSLKQTKIIKYIFLALLGTIVLAISSKIKIPFYPVPMTMQTLVVLFLGILCGWKLGLATIFLYLFEGIIGLPVFAGTPEKGLGFMYFTGPTMGYLIGFIPAVFFAGLLKISHKYNFVLKLILNFMIYTFSVSFIYFFGLVWLTNFVALEKVWLLGALPFLPAELLKISILTIFVTFFGKSILSWGSLR